jgi:hypothetical protein
VPETWKAQQLTRFLKMALIGLTTTAVVAMPLVFASPASADETTTPVITAFTASPATFYPTVRDGFLDRVTLVGSSDSIELQRSWDFTIRNANGVTVAERSGTATGWSSVSEHWDGRNLTGNLVSAGTFKATFTVTNLDTSEAATATRILYVKSDTIYKHITRSRTGVQTSARSHSTSCYTYRLSFGSLKLDCWGGREAVARYGFSLPNTARNVTWSVAGERGCCWNGTVRRTAWRTGNHVDVRVRVTNWAAYTVDRVRVTYTTAVRR